jgi:hypothetical protein
VRTDSQCKLHLKVHRAAAHGVHAGQDENDISGTNLVAQVLLQHGVVVEWIMSRHAQISPPEIRSVVEKLANAIVIIAVFPVVADEEAR